MLRKILFYITLVLVLNLTACGPASTKLTANDNGGQFEVKVDDLIVVTLVGNPSTGYTWEAKDLDTTMFELVGEPEFVSDNPDLVGAGGTLTLTFKALQAGTATLNLVYHRPWEADVEPIDSFSVTVTVK
jgi:inhibitor of cysteine peptidase